MTIQVKLTPALEKFAEDCVAEGRFGDINDVVEASLRLLQHQEQKRQAFLQSLKEAEDEADRGEVFTLEEVMADLDAIIEAAEAHAAE
jgi:antitoxin ParD1/3/4